MRAGKIFSESDKKIAICLLGLAAFVVLETILSPQKAIALLVGIFFFWCSWHRPLWVIAGIAVFLPLEPFALKWITDDAYAFAKYSSEVAIYVVTITVIVRKFIGGEKIGIGHLALPLAVFAGVALVSAIVNQNELFTSALGLRQLFRFVLLYIAVLLIRPSEAWTRKLLILFFALVATEGVVGVAQALTQGGLDAFLVPSEQRYFDTIQLTQGTALFWQEGQRIFATLGRYDQLGTFLCFFLLLGVGLCYEHVSTVWRRGILAIGALGVIVLVLTYSRASWFGFLGGFALIGLVLKRDKRVMIGFLAVVAAAVSIYATLGIAQYYRVDVSDQTVVERLYEAFSPERIKGEYYALGRMYFLAKTPPAVAAHAPFLGVGPGYFGGGVATALHETAGYTKLNLPYGINGTEGYVDNNWMSILGETGYIGLALYISLFVILFRSALRVWGKGSTPMIRGLALGYCGALAAFAFQGLFATYFEVRTIAPYIWIFGGILAAEEMKL